MKKNRGQATVATYDNYSLSLRLPRPIAIDWLILTPDTYTSTLNARADVPVGVRQLLAELFSRSAIVRCSITYGSRMELALSRTDSSGRVLLLGMALERFCKIFAQITGQSLAVTWQDTVPAQRSRRDGISINRRAFLQAFTTLLDAITDGIELAAAIEILSNGK